MKNIKRISQFVLILVLFLQAFDMQSFGQSTINSGLTWYDTDGNIIEAHGAGFLKVGDVFYWIGTDKSSTTAKFTSINCYASTDLVNWEFKNAIVTKDTHNDIGAYLANRIIERPKVIYNETTEKYVLWAHWDWSNYGEAQAVVFQCDKVDGDYEMVKHFRPFDNMARDCGLYKLNDGTAYFFAAANQNADMVLYQLTDDYLDVKEQVATLWPGSARESPVVFNRATDFYFLTSGTTGWAPNQAKFATASSMRGPWSGLRNVADGTTYDSQPTYVIPVEGTEDTTFVYCGDRWKDPELKDSKYIWFPIETSPSGMQIKFVHKWHIDVQKGTWVEVKDPRLSQDSWELISVDSEDLHATNLGIHAFDGNVSTFWHTEWKNNQPTHPHEIQIDLGDTASVFGFNYLPRQDNNVNGTILKYEFYASLDKEDWNEALKVGEFSPGSTEKNILLSDTIVCRYIRMLALSEINGSNLTSMAEINVLGTYGNAGEIGADISESTFHDHEFSVYPNPLKGTTLHVKENSKLKFPLQLSVFDISGNKIFVKTLSVGESTVKFHEKLASGTYILHVKSENGLMERQKLNVF